MSEQPLISIVIPAYHSEATIAQCLQSLIRQKCGPAEIVVIDSSPDCNTENLIRSQFPGIAYHHSRERLLPHEARNYGVRQARGDHIVFIDPDAYAQPGWLESLMAAQREHAGVIIGGVVDHGDGWLAAGMHLTKFDKWLPGGTTRRIDIGPTVNMLIARRDFELAGGLPGDIMIGDTVLSWQLTRRGVPLWFEPDAVVEHHHTGSWRDFLREMFARGREFGHARIAEGGWSAARVGWVLLISLLPIRLPKILGRVLFNAWQAGSALQYAITFPVIFTGHAARLAGETLAYIEHLSQLRQIVSCAS